MASSITGNIAAQENKLVQTQAGPQKPPPPPARNAAPQAPEDTIDISAAAQNLRPAQQLSAPIQLPTTSEIQLLQNLGQSVQQIATHYGISPEQVLSYLATPPPQATTGT